MRDYPLGHPISPCPPEVALYFIVQGQVRLLCPSRLRQRDVTAQLLQADDTFGADFLLAATSLPYRAIAASEVRLLLIPQAVLTVLLDQYPALSAHLQTQARHQERLVFFKSLTDLASQSSHQIQQWIPYVTEQFIPAHTDLTDHARQLGGRWWLRQGIVQGQPENGHGLVPPLQVGDSWGDRADYPAPIFAQTDVMAYQLPDEYWELAMGEGKAGMEASPSASSQPAGTLALPTLPPTDLRPDKPPAPLVVQPPANITQPTAAAPTFPKPLNRKFLDWLHQYPWVEQQSSSDCGAACLAMISQYWGKRFPLNFLREQANVGRSGASLRSLAKAAEGLGYHARPVRASLGRMAEQANPWIAHWQGNHYVVVYRVSHDQVAIADPALGRQLLSRQAFLSHWTGYALLLDPTENLYDTKVNQASLGRYLGALLPYRSLALQVIAVSLLIQVFGLVTPLFTQIILDQVVVQKSLETLNVFAVGLILFGIWSIAMTSVRQYLLGYFANRLDLTLISGFIRHAVALPLQFFESRRVGDIITRVQENQKIQHFLIGQVVLAWLNFVTGFVYLGLMLYYNWRLTLLVLGLIPPIMLLTLGSTPFLRKISRQIFKEAADQNSALVEMMTGIHTIKSAAAERELRWRWEETLTRQLNMRFRGQKFGIGLQAANGMVNTLGSTLLLWYGAGLVIQGELTIGQFVAFNMMIGYVISPVIALAGLWDELQEVLISVERLNDVFETRPEETPGQQMMVMPPIQGQVSFENITFRYSSEAERNTLQNISFEVKAGQTTAVVGRSGSGKSTLVKLLEGLYHPDEGRVLVDGHDIRHSSPPSLRSQLGVVPQECFLFSGTILDNILLYRSEFSLEDAVEAAKVAEAHPFIQSLPLGYHTAVGERGSTLSGGQRQRIAIARALLGNPRILILDEATSSLDTESERRFQKNLAHISRDRTTFIIAHRLSTVRHADQILVLDQGVLVEKGNHDELMAGRGLYYHLVQQQLDL
ncbi:MAG: peptidase domain-containing ABC transporter [Synechococcales bacterium]|nr:peptidase domain-containing ABC transporter [Synechococcales bacterium]